MSDERMKYLGTLSLLCEASPYVPADIRDSIEAALRDACVDGRLRYWRTLDRFDIEPVRALDPAGGE